MGLESLKPYFQTIHFNTTMYHNNIPHVVALGADSQIITGITGKNTVPVIIVKCLQLLRITGKNFFEKQNAGNSNLLNLCVNNNRHNRPPKGVKILGR